MKGPLREIKWRSAISLEKFRHTSVLVQEVLSFLRLGASDVSEGTCLPVGPVYLDATVGDGGHAEAILQASAPNGKLIGLDRDQEAIETARKRLSVYRDRVILEHENFIHMADVLSRHYI